MDFKDLGIVIIGRNEGQRLLNCLASVKPTGIKTVYVDSGSIDGSANNAGKFGVGVVRLNASQPFTAARARNEGLATLLKFEPDITMVQFIDGDCELGPGWIEAALKFMADHKDVAVACGRRRERFPERSVYNRLCDLEWNTPIGEANACGGDSLMRVLAFSEVGGFRPGLVSGEEPELCARIRERGWKIWRIDEDMTLHDASILRFGQWWQRAVRAGYGEAEIVQMKLGGVSAQSEKKEVARAVFWAGFVPIVIAVASAFHPAALLFILIYLIQIARVAFRLGAKKSESWMYGVFIMVAKFAQLQGNLKYWSARSHGKISRPIEYK